MRPRVDTHIYPPSALSRFVSFFTTLLVIALILAGAYGGMFLAVLLDPSFVDRATFGVGGGEAQRQSGRIDELLDEIEGLREQVERTRQLADANAEELLDVKRQLPPGGLATGSSPGSTSRGADPPRSSAGGSFGPIIE